MVTRSWNHIKEKIEQADKVVLVGYGKGGRELLWLIKSESMAAKIVAIFDNDSELWKLKPLGIPVTKICKDEVDADLYIITPLEQDADELKKQLEDIGISDELIVNYYYQRSSEYAKRFIKGNDYLFKEEIDNMYSEVFGRGVNWEDPRTYNEIIQWEKLNAATSLKEKLYDKYEVRDWVREKVGENYLNKLLGVYESAREINFDELPEKCVLKITKGSGMNILISGKTDAEERERIIKQLEYWQNIDLVYMTLSFHIGYKKPKIIAEEYLEGVADTIYDYNIFCFYGKPRYIWCIKGSHKPECRASFYDTDWNKLPFEYGYPIDPVIAPRPNELNEMLRISEILSEDFRHVRVDLYDLPDGRIRFGEMSFSSWDGKQHFRPEHWDTVFGAEIRNGK